jgi:tetratricopeptide (TPR) repeat protein
LVILGWSYTYKEMYEEAIATFQEVLTLRADDTATLGRLGLAYALSGQREEALIMLKRLNEQSKERYIPHFYRALINVGLGTMDEAFEHFKEAILAREPRLVWYIPNFRQHSIFQNLTSDPRYRELRKKLNLSD